MFECLLRLQSTGEGPVYPSPFDETRYLPQDGTKISIFCVQRILFSTMGCDCSDITSYLDAILGKYLTRDQTSSFEFLLEIKFISDAWDSESVIHVTEQSMLVLLNTEHILRLWLYNHLSIWGILYFLMSVCLVWCGASTVSLKLEQRLFRTVELVLTFTHCNPNAVNNSGGQERIVDVARFSERRGQIFQAETWAHYWPRISEKFCGNWPFATRDIQS